MVIIDLQRSNSALPFVPVSFGEIVRRSSALAASFRRTGSLVIYTHVLEQEMLSFPVDKPLPVARPLPGGDDLVADAGFMPGDVLITKRQWGAFYGSDLDQELRRHQVTTLVLAGVATQVGIESTARWGQDQGAELVFASDAIGGASQAASSLFMSDLLPRMGRVRTCQQISAAIRRRLAATRDCGERSNQTLSDAMRHRDEKGCSVGHDR